ncbi:hypothetical protein COLO4_36824 [Corchorus olitorius]|uniref:Uncharacterized protein n=1 Tax=Corchorus olitorius TaxID=93759 RepID=A0A1R3G4Z8_9ROSI|nr:hypothetical protein COLO4_36824 [Corchorus olitorius]
MCVFFGSVMSSFTESFSCEVRAGKGLQNALFLASIFLIEIPILLAPRPYDPNGIE